MSYISKIFFFETIKKFFYLHVPFWDKLTKPTWNTFYRIFFSVNTWTNLGQFLYNFFFFYKYMDQPRTLP